MEKKRESIVICVDFDGTCVTHEFPQVGQDIGAVPILKKIVEAGHNLILYTMRSDRYELKDTGDPTIEDVQGEFLRYAIEWFKDNEIPLHAVQENPIQKAWTTSPKCYAQLYIDDAALGCPLVYDKHHRPYVDWKGVEALLIVRGIIK
jgi:hypothetical protein